MCLKFQSDAKMKHCYLFIAVVLSVLCSCSTEYMVEGNSTIQTMDGRKLYLKAYRDNDLVNIDSSDVVHGKFSFMGTLDSAVMVNLFMDDECLMPFVLGEEPLFVHISTAQQYVTGSALNDTLYSFIRRKSRLDNELAELPHLESQMIMDGVEENLRMVRLNDEANRLAAQGYSLRYNWTGTKVRAVGRGGLSLDFRLSDRVSLGLEGAANVLTDRYNSKRAGNADWYFNVMAGVTINLGRTKNVRRAAPAPVAPAPAPQPVKVEEKPAPAPQPKAEAETVRRDVFFKINSSEISAAEKAKVEELARYLDNHKTAIVEVTGYADAGTGTRSFNERLSAERAAAVMKMLTGEYGVEAGRVRVSHKGDTVQPFAENDMNRVTICIISN